MSNQDRLDIQNDYLQLGCFQLTAEQITGLNDENMKLRWWVAEDES